MSSEAMIELGSNVAAECRVTLGSDATLAELIESAGGEVPADLKRILFRLASGASGNRNTDAAATVNTPALFTGWLPYTAGQVARTHVIGTGSLDVFLVS